MTVCHDDDEQPSSPSAQPAAAQPADLNSSSVTADVKAWLRRKRQLAVKRTAKRERALREGKPLPLPPPEPAAVQEALSAAGLRRSSAREIALANEAIDEVLIAELRSWAAQQPAASDTPSEPATTDSPSAQPASPEAALEALDQVQVGALAAEETDAAAMLKTRAAAYKQQGFEDWLQSKEPAQVRRLAAAGKLSADEVRLWQSLYERRLHRAYVLTWSGTEMPLHGVGRLIE